MGERLSNYLQFLSQLISFVAEDRLIEQRRNSVSDDRQLTCSFCMPFSCCRICSHSSSICLCSADSVRKFARVAHSWDVAFFDELLSFTHLGELNIHPCFQTSRERTYFILDLFEIIFQLSVLLDFHFQTIANLKRSMDTHWSGDRVFVLTLTSKTLWCSNKDFNACRTCTSEDVSAAACRRITVERIDRSCRDTNSSKCSTSN